MVVEITSYKITEHLCMTKHTRVQKLVCKWFNIIPERKWHYHIAIQTDIELILSDTLHDGVNKWRVVSKIGSTSIIASIYPIEGIYLMPSKLVLIFRMNRSN